MVAIYISDSKNSKIAGNNKVDATYSSIKGSCPNSCSLKNNGCYAQHGLTYFTVRNLDKKLRSKTALDVARNEAKAIDNSYNGFAVPGGRALRIHVSGDSRTIAGTKLINSAIKRWKNRGGGIAWTYTHSWRTVARKHWNNVSVLASIESVKDVKAVRKQGYAPAIVVPDHIDSKVYSLKGSDIKWIPCPAQIRDVACTECKLCWDSDRLFNGKFGIAFAAHGTKMNSIKRRLTVVK